MQYFQKSSPIFPHHISCHFLLLLRSPLSPIKFSLARALTSQYMIFFRISFHLVFSNYVSRTTAIPIPIMIRQSPANINPIAIFCALSILFSSSMAYLLYPSTHRTLPPKKIKRGRKPPLFAYYSFLFRLRSSPAQHPCCNYTSDNYCNDYQDQGVITLFFLDWYRWR